jgi:hypothetical protein
MKYINTLCGKWRSFLMLQHFRWLSSSEYMHSMYPNQDVELCNGFLDQVSVLELKYLSVYRGLFFMIQSSV